MEINQGIVLRAMNHRDNANIDDKLSRASCLDNIEVGTFKFFWSGERLGLFL